MAFAFARGWACSFAIEMMANQDHCRIFLPYGQTKPSNRRQNTDLTARLVPY
jgi:hypothetical protein